MGQEDGGILLGVLQYLDTVTLIQIKPVCKHWQSICIKVIDRKCRDKKSFQNWLELKEGVEKYCGPYDFARNHSTQPSRTDVEHIASTYGYPIDNWDVSKVTDFRSLFSYTDFNEAIGSWDVTNATSMSFMFDHAIRFNQDISSWDVSSVTDMRAMFRGAEFNGDILSWDVSNVTDLRSMFRWAAKFSGDISTWNVSRVARTNFVGMFAGATSFVDIANQLSWFNREMFK